MNVIILAGGLGTRLTEYTKTIPKPMVKVAGYPILLHIMNHYIKFGFKNFYIATGYKGYVIKKFFRKYKKNGELFDYKIFNKKKCRIALVDTGLNTMTGGRLKRVKRYLENEKFCLYPAIL